MILMAMTCLKIRLAPAAPSPVMPALNQIPWPRIGPEGGGKICEIIKGHSM